MGGGRADGGKPRKADLFSEPENRASNRGHRENFFDALCVVQIEMKGPAHVGPFFAHFSGEITLALRAKNNTWAAPPYDSRAAANGV